MGSAPQQEDTDTLLARASGGDHRAIDRLFDRHRQRLRQYLVHLLSLIDDPSLIAFYEELLLVERDPKIRQAARMARDRLAAQR